MGAFLGIAIGIAAMVGVFLMFAENNGDSIRVGEILFAGLMSILVGIMALAVVLYVSSMLSGGISEADMEFKQEIQATDIYARGGDIVYITEDGREHSIDSYNASFCSGEDGEYKLLEYRGQDAGTGIVRSYYLIVIPGNAITGSGEMPDILDDAVTRVSPTTAAAVTGMSDKTHEQVDDGQQVK